MRRIFYLTIIAALSIAALLVAMQARRQRAFAAQPSSATSAEVKEVKIDNFTFTPDTLTIPAGTTVTWTNHDDIPHTVVSDDKSMKSKALDTDDKFSFSFSKPGTYPYFCSLHPKMKGVIVVQ
jgi:plastocyanin